MLKFLLDENLPYTTITLFHKHGYDTIHLRLQKRRVLSDDEIIKRGKKERRIIVTRDLDFGNLFIHPLATHHGVIVLRVPDTFTAGQINKTLENFLLNVEVSELENALTILEPKRYRIRKA